jgi:hypothetical protein
MVGKRISLPVRGQIADEVRAAFRPYGNRHVVSANVQRDASLAAAVSWGIYSMETAIPFLLDLRRQALAGQALTPYQLASAANAIKDQLARAGGNA